MIHHVTRPNVLIILTDQQRYDAVGYVNPLVRTPNLDLLAAASADYRACVVQSPQCQPSRASIFTGRYPTAHRVWWNETDMPRGEKTLGNYLRAAGYRTGYFGKMHFGGSEPHTAIARHFGFDESYLFEDWLRNGDCGAARERFYRDMGHKAWTGAVVDRERHHEEVVTDRALDFVTAPGWPYFCVLSFHGPHPPYSAPVEFSAIYSDISLATPPKDNSGRGLKASDWVALKTQYYGAVSWIDACVGRLLAGVDLANTIVVFTSDHGDILGDHGLFSKGVYAYEGNVRVPLLVHLPGQGGRVVGDVVESIAILPTVMGACGLPAPVAVQGLPLDRRRGYALSMIGHSPRLRMIRTDRLKYWLVDGQEFLADVSDPAEVNVAGSGSRGADLQAMRWALLTALVAAEDPLPRPG